MLGILRLNIEKDLIKYAKFYKNDDELKLKYNGEENIDMNIKNTISKIINETNSLNSEIYIELCDFLKHEFEIPSILNRKDEKDAIEIEFKTFCIKNNLKYKEFTYKYIMTSQVFEQGKKHVVLYAICLDYLNFLFKIFENMSLKSVSILAEDNKTIDFLDSEISLRELMKSEVSTENFVKFYNSFKYKTQKSFSRRLSSSEKLIIRCIACVILFIICYSAMSNFIKNKINEKTLELENISINYDEQVNKINKDMSKIEQYTEIYEKLIKKDGNKENKIYDILENIYKFAKNNVEIISIENVNDDEIKLVLQSEKYEKLGEFKKTIDENNVLKDCIIKSTSKTNELIKIVLEGKLP